MKSKNYYFTYILILLFLIGMFSQAGAQAGEPILDCPMDETSGNIAADFSGNGFDGIASNTSIVTGISGNARQFNGSNSSIDFGNKQEFQLELPFSFSIWVNFNDHDSYQYLIANAGGYKGFRALIVPDTDGYRARFSLEGNSDTDFINSNSTLQTNTWYHIVGIAETNGNLKIYINGELDAEGTIANIYDPNTSSPLKIGHLYLRGAPYHLNGIVDEAKLFNYALSESEIDDIYNEFGQIPGDEMVMHLTMDDVSGNTVQDISGFDNHAIRYGTTITSGCKDNALQFGTASDYLRVQNSPSINFAGDFTIAAFVIIDSYTPDGKIVFKNDSYSSIKHYQLNIGSPDGAPRLGFQLGDPGHNKVFSNSRLPLNQCLCLVAIREGNEMRIYVDGQLEGTTSCDASDQTNSADLLIGKHALRDDQNFPGIIDEVRLYNYAIDEEEIEELCELDIDAPLATINAKYVGTYYSYNAACKYEILFDMYGSSPDCDLYILDYGDGSIDEFPNPKYSLPHYYTNGGSYTVKLQIIKNNQWSIDSAHIIFADFNYGIDNHSFANDDTFDQYAKPFFTPIEKISDEFLNIPKKFLKLLGTWFGKKEGFCSGFASTEVDYHAGYRVLPCSEQAQDCFSTYDLVESNNIAVDDIVSGFTWAALKELFYFATGYFADVNDYQDVEIQLDSIRKHLSLNNLVLLSMSSDNNLSLDMDFWHAVTIFGIIENSNNDFDIAICNNDVRSQSCGDFATMDVVRFEDDEMSFKYRTKDEGYAQKIVTKFCSFGPSISILNLSASEIINLAFNPIIKPPSGYFKYMVGSPVHTLIVDDNGNRFGWDENGIFWDEISDVQFTELMGGYPLQQSSDNAVLLFQFPNNRSYDIIHTGIGSGLLHQDLFWYDSQDTLNYFSYVDSINTEESIIIHLSTEPEEILCLYDSDADGEYDSCLTPKDVDIGKTTGYLQGFAFCGDYPIMGASIDLYNSNNTIISSYNTDSNGFYDFGEIPNGDYVVSISTPLGYSAEAESKEVKILGLNHKVDFQLNQLEISPGQRSRGYWAHQLHKALKNKRKDYDTDDFASFAELINQHFNQNELNPVDFYSVPQPASQHDSLMVLKKLLHMCNTSDEWQPFLKRLAKAQLMALMLNVVSGKVHQMHEITDDGRTVSQLITYCDMLVNDEIDPPNNNGCPGYGSPWFRCIYASYMLVKANLGLTIPAGMIPEDVINIAYKLHTDVQVPEGFELGDCSPNPFNPETNISYTIPKACHVTLHVYNIIGQKVATLVDTHQDAGTYTVTWDSRGTQGNQVSSGLYLYSITAGEFAQAKKMILMK